MATKHDQFQIFAMRFQKHTWDLQQGNRTIDQIHASLCQDARELINTPPDCDVDDITESQQIALDSQGEL
jgi:hypothetical protein